MTGTTHQNGQIPTDPHFILILILGIVFGFGQLNTEQTQALSAIGDVAELGLLTLQALHHFTGRR